MSFGCAIRLSDGLVIVLGVAKPRSVLATPPTIFDRRDTGVVAGSHDRFWRRVRNHATYDGEGSADCLKLACLAR